MSVRGLVTVVIGVVAFVVIDSLITNILRYVKRMVSLLSNQRVNWRLTRGSLKPNVTSMDDQNDYGRSSIQYLA